MASAEAVGAVGALGVPGDQERSNPGVALLLTGLPAIIAVPIVGNLRREFAEGRRSDMKLDTLLEETGSSSLSDWQWAILDCWTDANPLGLNESLLAMRAYAPFHQLYAVSMCFALSNGHTDRVPSPHRCYEKATANGLVNQIVEIAGTCLNTALEAAANEQQPQGRLFSPQNWIKAKTCLAAINQAIRGYFGMLPTGGKGQIKRLKDGMSLLNEDFEYRWEAD